jgi:isopentenyl phosphate kinase
VHIEIFDVTRPGNLARLLEGDNIGTVVKAE